MFFCQSFTNTNHTHRTLHPWTYKSGCSRDNGQTFNNDLKKYCKALATKNRQRRLINAKFEQKKTQNMKKKCQWIFQSKLLADFCQLRLEKCSPWHSWTNNCVCKYQMFKKNRTSRVLSGQVPFSDNLSEDKHNISVFPHPWWRAKGGEKVEGLSVGKGGVKGVKKDYWWRKGGKVMDDERWARLRVGKRLKKNRALGCSLYTNL